MVRDWSFGVQRVAFETGDEVATCARRVEELGYRDLFTADHVGALDPFVSLVVAARATGQLRVGPLVLNNEFAHPVLLARTAASVDLLTGGRLTLGLGTGYQQSEHDAIGLELRPPGLRVDRFDESLRVLRDLLDDGVCRFGGTHHRVDLDALGVRPAQQHVPFLIGGHGRRVVELAARRADIFQFTGIVHGADGTPTGAGFAIDEVVERARWLTEAAGDRDAEIERSALVQYLAVGDDVPSTDDVAAEVELDPEVIDETPFVLVGSVDQVVDKLGRLQESIGLSHVVVRDPDGFAPVVDALS